MKRNLKAVMADIKNGKGTRCLLLFGDDLQVQETRKAIIDLLIPEGQHGFNLEHFDGRAAPWEQVHASLMTPPLFPGTKVLWIENAPYFMSREQKGELGERVLQLWRDGKQLQAGGLLIDLLVVEGWTQEHWERLEPGSASELFKLLGAEEGEDRQQLDALLAYCKGQGMDMSRRPNAESQGLSELLDQGLPEWGFLLLTALQVDRRTRLYKRFDELGAAIPLGVERDRSGKVSRDSLLEFINERMRRVGKTMEAEAREIIVQRAASDLRSLAQELEKLFLFVGEHPAIRVQDVEMIFADNGEGWVFDLTRAIVEREPGAALSQLARLIAHGEHPLKLLGAIASDARRLLAARQLLDGELRGRWRPGMSYPQFQQQVLPQGSPLLTRNPYADYMCLHRAERLSLNELGRYMDGIHDADFKLKSSGNNPRLVMERLILGMCLGGEKRVPVRTAI
ncbi:MAG: DNA polymerase III subunit delta [Deltaproteobacteria bacterium]|nr:DNA polymerase III subunit delta [Deltaproteobacteria bacterium]